MGTAPGSGSTSAAVAVVPVPAALSEWQVMLSGEYKAYDTAVQKTIEDAFLRNENHVQVTIRGSEYMVHLKQPMKQVLMADPGRYRPIRRVPHDSIASPSALAEYIDLT